MRPTPFEVKKEISYQSSLRTLPQQAQQKTYDKYHILSFYRLLQAATAVGCLTF